MTKRWYLLIFALVAAMLLSSGIALGEENALSAPTIGIPSPAATVVRGEFLTVNVGEVEGDVLRYRAQVLDGSGEPISGGYSLLPGNIQVPTASLEPGSYTVRACAMDKDDNNGAFSNEIAFTVTEYQGSEDFIIHLNKNTALCREFVLLSIYAPGAESIKICCEEEPDLGWGSESDSWAYNIYMGEPDTYHFSAKAYYANGQVETSDTVTVTFQALGTLGEPQMNLQDGPVPAGQDLTVNYSFTDPQVQDGVTIEYCIELYDIETDKDSYLYRELTQSGTAVIPGSALEAGHRYEVHLYTIAKEPGYAANDEQRFIIASAGDSRSSLTVDGQSEITVPAHEDVCLTIHAPGATAIHLFKGRTDEWDYWGDSNGYQEDIEWHWNHWTGETVALYINVCFDPDFNNENAQWFTSEPLIVHVTADNGTLTMPEFTMPAQVTVGEVLDIHVTYVDENAEWCWADVYARNDNGEIDWSGVLHGDMDENGHIYLPTAMLQPNQAYMVHVACSGFNWYDSPAAQVWFTAVGEATDQPQFSVSKTDVLTSENFTAVGYVPNARHLRIYVDGDWDDVWGLWDGDRFNTNSFAVYNSGDTHLTLSALYQDDWSGWGDWDQWEDIGTITINASAPYGSFDLSNVQLLHEYPEGQDLTMDFSSTAAEWYTVGMVRENSDGGWSKEGNGNIITIPGELLVADIYHCFVHLYAVGYEPTRYDNFVFAVTESQQSNITLTAPSQVQCAEDFTITVNAPGATAVSWWIPNHSERMYQGSSCEDTEQIRGIDEHTVIYARAYYGEIDWDSFDWNDWQHNLDWGPISAVQSIAVTAIDTAGTPEVTGVPETVQWNDTLHITVGAADHAAWYDVRIRDGNNQDELYFEHLDGPGTVEYNTYDLTPGDYNVDVYVAGVQGYAETGVQKEFTVTGFGPCGTTNAQLASTSVSRGQMLEITVPAAENAVWYHARIRDNDWNEYCFVDLGGPGTYLLPTADVPAGEGYFVIISTGAPGYNWSDTDASVAARFAVTEDSAVFQVDKHEALTYENVTVSIFAPGAERIRFTNHYNGENDPGWWDENGWETEAWTDKTIWGWPEENITLRAEALYNGQWQLIGEQTVTVTATHCYDSEFMRSLVPATLNSGENLVINLPEGITGNWANVWDDTAGGPHIYWMNWDEGRESNYNYLDLDNPEAWAAGGEGPEEPCLNGDDGNIHIPAQYLKPNHTYRLDMDMWGGAGIAHDGVNGVKFSVVEPSQNEITLTINGSQDDQTLQVNEGWTVRVSAPGATAIRFFDGWGWHPRWVDENGVWEDGWGDGADGTKPRYAQACYDPIDPDTFNDNWDSLNWQGVSNVIRLTFTANGQIEAATFTLDNPVVARGDFAVLRLNGMVDGAQYHANAYWRDEDDNENWMGDHWFEHENGVIMLPTIDMYPGEWIIRLDSYGLVGLFGNNWESTVTITEPSPASLNFSKYDVKTYERFWNAIQVPGAVEITTTVNEPDGWQIGDWDNVWQFGPWDGEATQGEGLWFDHSGTYTVKLYARMSENGGWEYTGVSKTITATATHYYSSEYMRSLVPATVNSGEDLVINLPEGVTGNWANVFDDSWGGTHIYWMNWDEGRQSDYNYFDTEDPDAWAAGGEGPEDPCFHGDSGTIHIPAEYLKPNHTYHFDMDMWGSVGTEHDGVWDVKFSVIPGTDSRVKLRVNGMSGSLNVDVNAWYTVKATASGADEIRVFDGYGWHYADGASFEEDWRNGGNETRTLYAQARYNGGDWEGISNIITVSSYSDQWAPVDFSIVNENATVAKGDELVLRVAVDLEAEYNAHVKWMDENNNEQWIDGNYGLDGSTIRVSTEDLWEGDFYVRLDVFGKEGYCDNCLDLPFTVTRGNHAYFLFDKTDVEVMEPLHLSVYDPDAEKIRISSGYGWWDENGMDGNSWIGDIGWDHSPDDVTIAAEGWHGNEWVEIGHADIRITAPNGQLDEPAIEGSTSQLIEDGLNFWIGMPDGASYYYVEVWEATDDYDNRVWKFNSDNMEWNEWFHIDGSELQAGTAYTVYVNACGHGYECHATQRDITMVAERQPAPEITVASTTVQKGEYFRVTVNNYDPNTNYHAYFREYIIDENQNVTVNYDNIDVEVIYNGAEILLSTADLEADRDYDLNVDVFEKPGYADNGTNVTVTVTASSGNLFSLGSDHGLVGTDIPAYAHADGADQIHVVLEKDGQITDEWYEDGNAYIWSVSSWGVGTYTAKAYARFGNDWTLIDSHTLEITSQGQSVAPELTVASQILQPGEMPTITFGEGENVAWYKLVISDDDGWVLNYDIEAGPGTHTVNASWFEEGKTLEVGKVYTMDISVWQPGKEPGWSNQVQLAVIDSSCSVLTLNVPAALTEIEEEAFAGTPAKIVRINANPGLNIGYRAFADSGIIVAVIPDGVNVDPNAFEGCGPVVIVPSLD